MIMNFKSFIEVATPPHMPEKFYSSNLKLMKNTIELVTNLDKNKTNEFYNYMSDFVYGSDRRNIQSLIDDIRHIENSWQQIDVFLSYAIDDKQDSTKWLKLTINQRLLKALQDLQEDYLNSLDTLKEELINSKEPNNPILDQLTKVTKAVLKMKKWYTEYVSKTESLIDLQNRKYDAYYGGSNKVSFKSEKVETLYHATTALNSIVINGFKTRKELLNRGIGGGPDDLISFTGDIQIAESIVWALRRASEIAKGKIGIKQLEALSRYLGADFKDVNKFVTSSDGPFDVYHHVRIPFEEPKSRQRTPLEQKHWLFHAFTYMLAVQSKVYNPVFANVEVTDFQNLNYNDIGIIAANVDMEQVKEYLPSMEEYRVPVSAILKVWKIPYRGKV